MEYFILLLFLIIIFIYYFLNIYLKTTEHFCKIPELNRQGEINDKRVAFLYSPQSNIITSSCNKYWKDWPKESNSELVSLNSIPIQQDQIELPMEKQFGNNNYKAGLLNFSSLSIIVSDKIDYDIFDKSKELLLSPIDKKPLEYKYQLDFKIMELNKKTWIDRWKLYNPSVKMHFPYEEIKSPIEKINILNNEFVKRCNYRQKELMSDNLKINYGLMFFDIYKYRILEIRYLHDNKDLPIYIIEIILYRETDLYMNTFSYIGFIEDDKIKIVNVDYIGVNATDNYLQTPGYNSTDINQEIINHNFSNKPILEKDPDAIVHLYKKYLESFKLKNQYACFNLDYNPEFKESNFLDYYSREMCESNLDMYGRKKTFGVFDKPCQEDSECPFYKINKNYENDFGKCINGKCQLPLNMENIGYHYFKTDKAKKPLCYNCKSNDKFQIETLLDTCCDEQYDKTKYPFLNSPDYAFEDDIVNRTNYFHTKFCTFDDKTTKLTCDTLYVDNINS